MLHVRPFVLAAAALSVLGVTTVPTAQATPAAQAIAAAHAHTAAAPRPVTRLAAFTAGTSASMQWTNPSKATFTRVVARYQRGATAPAHPHHGRRLTLDKAKASTATLQHLRKDTTYSVSVWVRNRAGNYSARRTATFTTSDDPGARGGYSTRITDTARHPLAHVRVTIDNYDADTEFTATTGTDGRVAIALPSAPAYFVDIDGSAATGGTADATGYVGSADEFTLSAGQKVKKHTFALAPGGAVTGRVTDAAGDPLSGVSAYSQPVSSYVDVTTNTGGLSILYGYGTQTSSRSAADGTFTIRGLPATALLVCFAAGQATRSGDSADTSAYADNCEHATVAVAARSTATVPTEQLVSAPGGVLAGTVTAPTGARVAGAIIEIYPHGSDDEVADVSSDHNGTYRAPGLASGSYRVCVQTSGVTAGATTGYAPRCLVHDAIVSAGHRTTANARLRLGAAVTGRVTGPTGHPLAGVRVLIEHPANRLGDGPLGYATTDSHGIYTVTDLPRTTYKACFDPSSATGAGDPTGALSRCYGRRFRVRLGAVRAGIDRELKVGAALTGTLTDGAGQPVANALVNVESNRFGDYGGDAQTNAHGHYTVRGLSAGTYRVCFVDIGPADEQTQTCRHPKVTVRVGHTTRYTDAALPPQASVHVTVDDTAGHPLSGVNAAVLSPCTATHSDCSPQPVFSATRAVNVDASWVTNAHGTVNFGRLRPGRYVVCLFAYFAASAVGSSPTGYADTCTGSTFNLMIAKNTTRSVTAILRLAGQVTGTVTDTTGHPVSGARVHVTHSAADDHPADDFDDQGFADLVSPTNGSRTAADGTYVIRGVAPGTQRVCITADTATGGTSAGGYLDRCVTSSVSVTAGATTTAGTVALPSAAAIAGRITNTAGHGQDGEAEVYDSNGDEVAQAEAGGGGRYVVNRLPAGAYLVCFDAFRYASQCFDGVAWGDGPIPSAAKTVTATAGMKTTGIDARLHRGG